jgi:IS30 family transposase
MDLSSSAQAKLDAVARELNGRPCETLMLSKPAEVFVQAGLVNRPGFSGDSVT